LKCQRRAQGLMWGAGGPFPLASAMVVVVVTPVVFCYKATENCNKSNKISCLDSFFYVLLHIVKHIAVHVTLIVAWPEPKLCSMASPNHFSPIDVKHIAVHLTLIIAWPEPKLCSMASPNHFSPIEPWHIGYCQKALVIARTISGLN
jgi:hypothetical protein